MGEGFRLVRYADDFVVLTRNLEEARKARDLVRKKLRSLELALNEDDTAIRSIDAGFTYLGYLFCRSIVLEHKSMQAPEDGADALEAEDVPAASWLAQVPLERLEELVAAPRPGRPRHGELRRVPLGAAHALATARRPFYVSSPRTRLWIRGETLVARNGKNGEVRTPLEVLSHVILIGRTGVTVPALSGLGRRGIPAFFCRRSGELYSTFGPHEPEWPLWLAQARLAEDRSARMAFASEVVVARLRNLAVQVVRWKLEGAPEVAAELRELAGSARNATSSASLRGLEGRGAARMFAALSASLPAEWGFTRRARRPPPDPVNAMLSFGYSMLHHHLSAALVGAGLNPRIGLYHRPRGAHHALASDLQEELRHLVEGVVWTVIRRGWIKPDQFVASPDGRFPSLMSHEARRTLIDQLERRFTDEVTPEPGEDRLSYRSLMARQARQVAELARGAQSRYRPLVRSR